jgi:hypothetical protein
MALLSFSQTLHEMLARIRRRAWIAIGLCLVGQIGNAALHANEPDGSALVEFAASKNPPLRSE